VQQKTSHVPLAAGSQKDAIPPPGNQQPQQTAVQPAVRNDAPQRRPEPRKENHNGLAQSEATAPAVTNDNMDKGEALIEKIVAPVENSQAGNGIVEVDASTKPDELKKEGERTKMSFLLN
jgi:hypothetical protein